MEGNSLTNYVRPAPQTRLRLAHPNPVVFLLEVAFCSRAPSKSVRGPRFTTNRRKTTCIAEDATDVVHLHDSHVCVCVCVCMCVYVRARGVHVRSSSRYSTSRKQDSVKGE